MCLTKHNLKKLLRISCSLFTLIFVLTALPIRGEAEIYDSVIRLHVIANSNTEQDQSMKLYVRDRLIEECAQKLIAEDKNAEAARARLEADMEFVTDCAQRAVDEYCDINAITDVPTVYCTIGEERYPFRSYEGLCFPAGEYVSLRVVIGEGGGENWWCVLFPPLCFAAASEKSEDTPDEDEFISVGLTPDQYGIIAETEQPKYRIRFRILEWIEDLFS